MSSSGSPSRRSRRLPDEIMCEILKDRALKPRDLFNCALVSRRYLSTVQKALYRSVGLVLWEAKSPDGDVNGTRRQDYSLETWRLLQTLVDKPHLAALVEHVSLDRMREIIDEGSPTCIETNGNLAVSSFFRLTPNLVGLSVGKWDALDWRTISQLRAIKDVYLSYSGLGEIRKISRWVPELHTFEIDDGLDGTLSTSSHIPRFASLKTFSYPWPATLEDLPFLARPFPTLETLHLDLDLAIELDFAQFPALRHLELDTLRFNFGGDDDDDAPDYERGILRLLDSLAGSPSLTLLSLPGSILDFVDDKVRTCPVAPALRTLRFWCGPLRLDSILCLLESPLTSNLGRLVIPACFAGDGSQIPGDCDPLDIDALRGKCQGKGVELTFVEFW